MLRSLRVGRFFGIDVYLHWTFWALPIIQILLARAFTVRTAAFMVALTLAIAVCVIIHEFGHVLVARLFGINTRDIIMTPLGGIARLERMSEKPIEEIVIALAGPAVNVLIALLMAIPWTYYQQPAQIPRAETWPEFFWMLWITNIGLVLFNMLPAFPMDGGRVLRGFLSLFTDRIFATKIAVFIAFGCAGLMALTGIIGGNFMWLLIAGFIVTLGPLELAMLKRVEEIRRRARAEVEALPLNDDDEVPSVVPAPPEPNFSGYTWDRFSNAWVEWRDGWPVRKYRMRMW
jgi:Zn-dependent protease